jgi:hypothetical protein
MPVDRRVLPGAQSSGRVPGPMSGATASGAVGATGASPGAMASGSHSGGWMPPGSGSRSSTAGGLGSARFHGRGGPELNCDVSSPPSERRGSGGGAPKGLTKGKGSDDGL